MLKFIIDEPDKAPEQATTLRLFLRDSEDGNVSLMAQEEDGTTWHLVFINSDGTLERAGGVPEHLGFQTEDGGYIVTTDE